MDAWSLLTSDEQSVMSDITNREIFNGKIGNGPDKDVENKITLVRNFIDSMGARSAGATWKQIKSLEDVWLNIDPKFHEGGGVTFLVDNKEEFLDTLGKNGFVINPWYDKFNKAHPHDSAREITNTSRDTAAHLANDSEKINVFLLHWDKRSSEFKHVDRRYLFRWIEQLAAGRSHHEPFTATEVRKGLIERGIAT